jgi:hypothetical protein
VQAAYKADAFVKSRDFASAAMEAGRFQTIGEGQSAWATETIKRIEARNTIDLNKKQNEGAALKATNVSWANYQAINGVVPGSDIEAVIEVNLSAAESTQAAIDRLKGISHSVKSPTKSIDGNLNKAYSLLMQQNIGRDMIKGATTFASRDMIYKITESQAGLKRIQHGYNVALSRENARLKMITDANKAALDGTSNTGGTKLGDAARGSNITYDNPNTISVSTNEKGEVTNNPDIALKVSKEIVEVDNSLAEKQIEIMFRAMEVMTPKGNSRYTKEDADAGRIPNLKGVGDLKDDMTYTIPMPTKEDANAVLTGDEETIKKILLQRNESGSGFIHRDIINQAYGEVATKYKNTSELFGANASINKDGYKKVYDQMFASANSIQTQQAYLDVGVKRTYDDMKTTYDNTIVKAYAEEDNLKLLSEAGFPDIWGDDGRPVTQDEYIKNVVAGVTDGSITNPDLWNWDGTSSKDYMIIEKTLELTPGGGYANVTVYTDDTGAKSTMRQNLKGANVRPSRVLDLKEIEDEAGQMFTEQYEALNKGLTGGYGNSLPSAGFFATIDGRSGDFATVQQTGSHEVNYNPLIPDAEASAIALDMINQMAALKNKGEAFGLVTGNVGQYSDADMLIINRVAEKIHRIWLEDVAAWENNPDRSKSDPLAPTARIVHMPVFGQTDDMDKSRSAYQVYYGPEWLASKIKGGAGKSQYGVITTDDIAILQRNADGNAEGGAQASVTMIYKQDSDISARNAKNRYYSAVNAQILQGRDSRGGVGNYADYAVPGSGLVNAAEYRINETTTGYSAIATRHIYQPYNEETKSGGTYVSEQLTIPFDMRYGLQDVDRQAVNLRIGFEQLATRNSDLQKKDEAQYGIKTIAATQLQNR